VEALLCIREIAETRISYGCPRINPQLYIDEEGELFAKEDTLLLNTLGVSAAYSGAVIKALKKRNEDQAELISALSERLKQIESTLGINNKPAS